MQAVSTLRTGWLGYVAALAAVALVSVGIGLVQRFAQISNLSLLYLLAVLVSAVRFGQGPAIVAAVSAFLVFDWFFTEPRLTLTVADPAEWIALLLFLAVAVTAGSLAANQRRQAFEAQRRAQEALLLYDVARLLSVTELQQAIESMAQRLQQELHPRTVLIEVPLHAGAARAVAGDRSALLGASDAALPTAAHVLQSDSGVGGDRPHRWVRVVPASTTGRAAADPFWRVAVPVAGSEPGTLAILPTAATHFDAATERLLLAVAAQIGASAERRLLREEAVDAEVLRRTDELKTALIHAVSHDFRTPLSSIIAAAGSLRQQDVPWTDEERRTFAADIEAEAQRLNRLVANLLDLSRIQGGALVPAKGWYDLGALIDDVVGRLRPVTGSRSVTVHLPDDLPPVQLDYVEIDQVLTNLLENAAKHGPADGPIDVTVTAVPSAVEVSVADRGKGFAPQEAGRLFEPFYRVTRGTERVPGLGLGLAVAKGLVEAHGGRISAAPRSGGGAVFSFTLPLEPAPGLAEEGHA